ncbi:PREDICTED: uncharacterized protein LOC103342174 [Prunus mume]|uniref:acylphosphatase n=1 Tax=Prunus mume TaxID=102107 RepID=A0ABM0PSX5_PRUMU|nr:PREDICTED: uncharacterized protein LOC103342174 [Prunus mume]
MASAAISVRPLISAQHKANAATRFLASRSNTHPTSSLDKWTQNDTASNDASSALRLVPHLHNPRHHFLHPPLSICRLLLLPRPPLSPLLRPRPPLLRHYLPLMTTPQAASDSTRSSSASSKTVRLVVKGRVQGVFYRNWTIENATQLGLKGWVRNRRDGSVETLLSGNPDAVQEMEQRCRRGPPSAMVTGLEVFPSTEDPGDGFERKQTV